MSFENMAKALRLEMPSKVPRTEYSASFHWPLVNRVTGSHVNDFSAASEKEQAVRAFEKAWDFGFTWSTLISSNDLTGPKTTMGHAVYLESGADFNDRIYCPFETERQVLSFDPYAAYGERDEGELIRRFNEHAAGNTAAHPDQVNMTGIYITMISGLIEIFGWNMLLSALGEDPDGFGEVANRYAGWIEQFFKALARSDSQYVMIHDDIVWTSGPFANPKWYRKYVFPNYKRLFEPLHKAGKTILYTSDANFTVFVDDIMNVGINALVMEPTTDMAYIAGKYGQKVAFVGNADCRVLTFGTRDEIRREVERCFAIGRDCPGFVMAVGNHIPPNVPVENALYYNNVYEELAYRR